MYAKRYPPIKHIVIYDKIRSVTKISGKGVQKERGHLLEQSWPGVVFLRVT